MKCGAAVWITKPLGEFITFQRGFDITKNEQRPGLFPVYSSSGPNSTHDEFKVKGPSVIIGRKGSLGTVFFEAGPFWPHDTTLWVKDFRGNDARFVYYFLKTMGLERYDAGASNPTLNRNHVHLISVAWPAPQEQTRIAALLSAYDELIENNLRRIRILEEMARALYREWFVDAARGDGSDGWRLTRLKEVAAVNRAQISAKAPPDRFLYIDIASVAPGNVNEVTPYAFADAPGRARRVIHHGDILWSCVRPNRRSHVLILNPEPETVASTGFAVLTATKVPYTFLYQATTTDEFVAYLTNHATGAAYPAVTATTFQNAELLLPPEHLLTRFAEITIPQAELIAVLQRQNANLRQTRDLLLPRLLSGQLSVPDLEAGAVEIAEVAIT